MDILKTVKKIAKSVSSKDGLNPSDIALVQDYNDELKYAQIEKYRWDKFFNDMETRYSGERIFNNITTKTASVEARTLIRLFYMLTEAQIDLTIPDLVFKPVTEEDEEAVKSLQFAADCAMRSNDIDEVNSDAEREVKRYGTTIYKVVWDQKYKRSGYRGKPKIILVHPRNWIPLPGTINKGDPKGGFYVENKTLRECIQQYGEKAKLLPQYGELCPEFDMIGRESGMKMNKTADVKNQQMQNLPTDHPLYKYTIFEYWRLDDEGDVEVVSFSGDLILETVKKYWKRRKVDPESGEVVKDKEGNDEYWEKENPEDKTQPISSYADKFDTEVEFHLPTRIPFVIQNNVPRSKCIWGVSDGEIIGDLEESIKKMCNKVEEGILKGSTKVFYNEEAEPKASKLVDNDDLTFIPCTDPNNFKEIQLKANNNDALGFMQYLIDLSQQLLQINKSFQGRNENEASSGKMAIALINQTAEQINIKINEKNIAYRKLYRIICDYLLAFSDGDIPYRNEREANTQYGKFNRYDVIRKDTNGEWIYPDFDVEISKEAKFPKTSSFIFESTLELASGQFFAPTPQNILVWTILSKTGYPNAEIILTEIKRQVEEMQQQGQMDGMGEKIEQPMDEAGNPIPQQQGGEVDINQVIAQLPPNMQEQFKALSPEEQQTAMQDYTASQLPEAGGEIR